ncbi:hypothetical protein NF865_08490 [Thermococcus aggregans]|uniref:Lrp/AsnC family transcriptional regulator n=1 Tax=Thermococcus aggregans TaxID=110163 RepID=A0A9E7SP12_THEAG|nr:hypothetical protein [Thermococcus aggregans]USS40347.1 hypothetical protein NF865_08490 [Thermococcus aggregans]
MPFAIYLIKVRLGREKEIKETLLNEMNFDEVYVVTGSFDIIGKVHIPLTRRALIGLKEELEKLEGVIEVKYLEARD